MLDAHEAAVSAAMAFLEDHAALNPARARGLLQVDTEGLLAAAFVHRTSRAADSQLHTHLLLANKVRTQDGRWLSLDAASCSPTRRSPACSTRRPFAQS